MNRCYKVNGLRSVNTKYGPKIVADLDELGTLFLPNRYVRRFMKDGDNPRNINILFNNTYIRIVGRESDRYNTPIYEFLPASAAATEEQFEGDDEQELLFDFLTVPKNGVFDANVVEASTSSTVTSKKKKPTATNKQA